MNFNGNDLNRAFDAGAQAQFDAMVESCDELMKYDDVYEVYKFLVYYAEENKVDRTKLDKMLKEHNYEF